MGHNYDDLTIRNLINPSPTIFLGVQADLFPFYLKTFNNRGGSPLGKLRQVIIHTDNVREILLSHIYDLSPVKFFLI